MYEVLNPEPTLLTTMTHFKWLVYACVNLLPSQIPRDWKGSSGEEFFQFIFFLKRVQDCHQSLYIQSVRRGYIPWTLLELLPIILNKPYLDSLHFPQIKSLQIRRDTSFDFKTCIIVTMSVFFHLTSLTNAAPST